MIIKKNSNIDFVAINQLIAENAEKILEHFNIEYISYRDRLAFPCPIHDSDSAESLTLYRKGSRYIGNFVCWTQHCEHKTGAGGVNLIKFLLSKKNNREFNLVEAAKWITEFLKLDINSISVERNKKEFVNSISVFEEEKTENKLSVPRDLVRASLKFPCDYFLKRGFSEEILQKYDVGICSKFGKQMYNRAVVPIYEKNLMVGCVGRALTEKCPICDFYHDRNKLCPQDKLSKSKCRKWINSKGFKKTNHLYNEWFAAEHITKNQTAILVEGQGDVWRFEEAGIHISLGMFGCDLNYKQVEILNKMGVMNIWLALNNDPPGQIGTQNILKNYNKYFNIKTLEFPGNDIGDLSINQIKDSVKVIKCI